MARLVNHGLGGLGREPVTAARAGGRDLAFICGCPVEAYPDVPLIDRDALRDEDE